MSLTLTQERVAVAAAPPAGSIATLQTVLIILHSLQGGGAERAMVHLANHLDRRRWRVVLALGEVDGPYLEDVRPDVTVERLGPVRARHAVGAVLRAVWRWRPAAVLSTAGLNFAVAIARPAFPAGTRVVLREANTVSSFLADVRRSSRLRAWAYGWVYRTAYRSVDAVVCQNEVMREDLARCMRVPMARLARIPNPVDAARLDRAAVAPVSAPPGPGPHLVAVGRCVHQKGHDVLLHAFAAVHRRHPDATLSIVGDGEERPALERLAGTLGVQPRVRFLGFLRNPYPLMARADLFVSASRFEGTSNAVLEALALGTPVVATDCPSGIREHLVPGVNGWLAAPEDPAALAAAIETGLAARGRLDRDAIRASCLSACAAERVAAQYDTLLRRPAPRRATAGRMRRLGTRLMLVAGSFLLLLFMIEAALSLRPPQLPLTLQRQDAAARAGTPFDLRSKREVVEALRAEGMDAWPAFFTKLVKSSDGLPGPAGTRVFPLAGVSSVLTVNCNERGAYATFGSDAYGFNNPPGVWTTGVEAVVLGDSFGFGDCVAQGQDTAGRLRASGRRAVNLSMGGAGPLQELAMLAEYGPSLQPRTVLWLYYEKNDLGDLMEELRTPTLRRYIEDPAFIQGLIGRQPEIDAAIRRFVAEDTGAEAAAAAAATRAHRSMRSWLMLAHVRGWLSNSGLSRPSRGLTRLHAVLDQAQQRTQAWGGALYFVYLPEWTRFAQGKAGDGRWREQSRVLATARSLGLPVIDFTETMRAHQDPLSLFPFRIEGHYTAEGYALLARAIEAHLPAAGPAPTTDEGGVQP